MNTIDYIDYELIDKYLDEINKLTGFATALIDPQGRLLSHSGWRPLCIQFFRQHPETNRRCIESDTILANSMETGESFHHYQCLNGLVDAVVPITIEGEHAANLYSGQFFLEKPDVEHYRQMATTFGFDERPFMKALREVPVVKFEEMTKVMGFLQHMTQMISEDAIQRKLQSEANREKELIDHRYHSYVDHAPLGVFTIDKSGRFLETNQAFITLTGHPEEMLLEMCLQELIIPTPPFEEDLSITRLIESSQEATNEKIQIRTFQGGRRWLNLIITDIEEDRYLAFTLDITEKRITEERLRENQRAKEFFSQTANDILLLRTPEEVYRFAIETLERLLGKTAAILFIEYDEQGLCWTLKAVSQHNTFFERLPQLLGFPLVDLNGEVLDEMIHLIRQGRLVEMPLDIQSMFSSQVSRETETIIKQEFGFTTLHSIIFEQTNDLLGNILYMTTEETPRIPPQEIETYTSQLANALNLLLSEKALRESEEKLRGIYDVVPIGIGIVSKDRYIKEINPSICEITGYPREELIGMHARSLYPTQSEYEEIGEVVYHSTHDKRNEGTETRWVRKDGKVINIALTSTPIEYHDPSKDYIFTAEDITLRKESEDLLKERERSLNEAQQIAHMGSWTYDVDSEIFTVSDEINHIYGFALDDKKIPLQRVIDRIHDGEKIVMDFNRAIKEHTPFNLEFTIDSSTGGPPRILNSKGFMTPSSEGKQRTLRGITQDVTEMRAGEKERRALKVQLLQAQKMESIGRLAGGVAHDFNNMLGVILGFTEMTLMELEEGSSSYNNLQEIYKAAERSAALTSQLLAFARKQPIKPKTIDLNDSIEEMYKMLIRLIGEDTSLEWTPSPSPAMVHIDPSQVNQILTNLCVNARDAMEGLGRISISTQIMEIDDSFTNCESEIEPGTYVELEVSDNGSGMDSETLEHLFEPFYTTKEMSKGTGLGFSMVYGIIHQNNGCISVYSEVGIGTTIRIHLPLAYSPADTRTLRVEPDKMPQGQETILLVEDEIPILRLTSSILTDLGYEVLATCDPKEALKIAKEHSGSIDLVLSDVIMPGLNGRELVITLQLYYPKVAYLFMSGYTADIISHQGIIDEGLHFIQKPFTIDGLARKVREVIEER